MNAPVRVLAQPHLLDPTRDRVEFTVAPGQTIAQMVAEAMPAGRRLGGAYFRVTLNGHPIGDALWHAVKPKPGTHVLIRVVPQGDTLKNVLTIALTVAAVAAGQFYGPMLAGELLFGGLGGIGTGSLGTVLSGAITATTLLAGTLLINALIPIRSDKKDAATYGIQGLRNQAQPDGVVPGLLGFHRSTPPYGMLPYTESVGDDRFVTANFIHGYGPIATRNHRIGETPIEKYQEVTAEHREGRPGDAPLTLTPRQVVERALSIELAQRWPRRRSANSVHQGRTSRASRSISGSRAALAASTRTGRRSASRRRSRCGTARSAPRRGPPGRSRSTPSCPASRSPAPSPMT